jgi:hypothetical protein
MEKHVQRLLRSVKENQFTTIFVDGGDEDTQRSQVVATSNFNAYIHKRGNSLAQTSRFSRDSVIQSE